MVRVESLNPDSSIKHWMAHDLRFFREKAGLSQAQLAAEIGATKQAVSNYEHARDGWNLQDHHVAKLDEVFGLPGHFTRLLRLSRIRDAESFFSAHLDIEARADEISVYELGVISGLLQTPRYARALITEAGAATTVDADLKTRLDRQVIFERPRPPYFWFLLDESVLRRRVASAEVMREQLQRILDVSEMPNVSVRVVPHRAGWHPGLSSAFKVMEAGKPYVYTETTGGGTLISAPDRVRGFQMAFKRIGAKALNEDDTMALIRSVQEEYRDELA